MFIFDSVIKPDLYRSPLHCLQVFAVVSLLPSVSFADLTCEALLAGNVSRKSKTSINSTLITTLQSGFFFVFFYKELFPRAVRPECLSCLAVSTLVGLN